MLKAIVEALIRRPDSQLRTRLLGAGLRRMEGVPVRSSYGVAMAARGRDWTNFLAISGNAHQDYDDVFRVVDAIRPGMAFVDIGANAGLFSMVAGKRLGRDGRILAFEPSLPIFRDLVANAVANGLINFFPFNAALGTESGTTTFSPGVEGHSGGAHLDGEGNVIVALLNFAEYWPLMRTIIGDRAIMIKIDVEGAENLVLESIRPMLDSGQVETCVVEIDPTYLARFGGTAEALYARMAEVGLRPRLGLGVREHYNEIFERA